MRFAHDLKNIELGKPIFAPKDARQWIPVVHQLENQIIAKPKAADISCSLSNDCVLSDHKPLPIEAVDTVRESRPNDVEHGHTICIGPTGEVAKGPENVGTKNKTKIEFSCPEGMLPFAFYHNHPSGLLEPSDQDLRLSERSGLPLQCIGNDTDKVVCFIVKTKEIDKNFCRSPQVQDWSSKECEPCPLA